MIALSFEFEKKAPTKRKYSETYYKFPTNILNKDVVLSQRYQTSSGSLSFLFRLCENWHDARELIETGDMWYEDYKDNIKAAIDWEREIKYEDYVKDKQKYEDYIKNTIIADLVKLSTEAMHYLGAPVAKNDILLVNACRKSQKKLRMVQDQLPRRSEFKTSVRECTRSWLVCKSYTNNCRQTRYRSRRGNVH